ncbi:MAG: hypothetical protein LBQ08_01370, partial [Holosporaceae bacterium]|nr:hypothetical protein [Holosporaceae bacterium]
MKKKIISLLFGLVLLFQSVSAGSGASKVLVPLFNGALTLATGGTWGAAAAVTAASGLAVATGRRDSGVHINVTDHGLEHSSVTEQRARDRHLAEYCRTHGFRSEVMSPQMRADYNETFGTATVEELTADLIINRVLNPSYDQEEAPTAVSEGFRDRLRRAAGPPLPNDESDFITLLNAEVARARVSGEMPPENFMDQYPWLNFPNREMLPPANDFMSMMSETTGSAIRSVNRASRSYMASMSDGLSSGNDITARLQTLNVGPVHDRTSLVADLLAIQFGAAERMSPPQMREIYPDAWRFQSDRTLGPISEARDWRVAVRLRETGHIMAMRDCDTPEAV